MAVMSTCISRHGEWSDHILDDAYTCTRCLVLDEDALVDELRQARARLAEVEAERDAARADLARWESGQRIKGLPQLTSVPDGLQYAAALVRAQGTEGGEEHDDLLAEAGVRLRDLSDAARHLLAEAVVLRAELEAARPIVEAAAAWRGRIVDDPRFWADDEDFALIAAVDLYRSATSDHPSTTEEKP